MSYETTDRGTWVRARSRAIALVLSLITIIVGLAAVNLTQASAAEKELSFSLDRGIINLGSTTGVKIVDPDLVPPDTPAALTATLAEDGTVTAQKSAFTFPVKTITNLATGNNLLPFVDAKIEITAADAISGDWDSATGTGAVSIPAQADITVYSAGSPASVAKCRVSGFNLDLATAGTLVDPATDPDTEYDAAAFAPPSGDGAMVDNWDGLPDSTILGGSLGAIVCPAVNGLIGGAGGIWLSGNASIGGPVEPKAPQMAPQITLNPPKVTNVAKSDFEFAVGEGETETVDRFQCRIDSSQDSAWKACDSGKASYNVEPGIHKFEVRAGNPLGYGPAASYGWTLEGTEVCPDGQIGTPPNCVTPPEKKARLGALKVKPKHKAVKRGKKATFRVKVRNKGDAAAKRVKVCVKAPKRQVRVKRCVKIRQIAAGKTKTAKFKVKVKRKARKGKKVTLRFKATSKNAGKKNARAKVRIK